MTSLLIPSLTLAILLLVFGILAIIAWGDIKARIIPNWSIVTLFVLFIPIIFLTDLNPTFHFVTLFIVFVFTFFCFHRKWLGGGDAKLIPVIGLWVGPHGILPFLLMMSFGGVFVAMILMMVHHKRTKGAENWKTLKLPYGVAIAAAAAIMIGMQYLPPVLDKLGAA